MKSEVRLLGGGKGLITRATSYPSQPMAKTTLNAVLSSIRGRVGDVVFKRYSYGTVVTRVPRMEQVKWSPAQLAQRQRMREAGKFYRSVLADPKLKKKYETIAAKKKIPLSAATMAEFLKRGAADELGVKDGRE